MEGFYFETAHHIQIRQRPAGLGDRILAQIIDSFIMGFYALMVSVMVYGILKLEENSIALISLLILPFLLYHLLFEIFMNGQSIGKRAMSIRVVQLDGSKASVGSYLVRWLLRPIDLTVSSGGIAVLCVLLGGKGQRLGDIAAGTTVISLKQKAIRQEELLTQVPPDHQPRYPQVINLSDAQVNQIRKIRLEALQSYDFELINKLAQKTADILQISHETKPLEFIDQVILDYEYYAQKEHGDG